MKALALLILFCAASYGADITTTNVVGDITTIISEHQDKDGKPEWRGETSYRNKVKILQVFSRRNKQGIMAITSRAYCANGKAVMIESDDDGDGIFEHVMVFQPGSDDFELFVRQPDGSVKPESTKEIELKKKQETIANDSLRKVLQTPEMSDADLGKLLQENRQKIQAVEELKANKSD